MATFSDFDLTYRLAWYHTFESLLSLPLALSTVGVPQMEDAKPKFMTRTSLRPHYPGVMEIFCLIWSKRMFKLSKWTCIFKLLIKAHNLILSSDYSMYEVLDIFLMSVWDSFGFSGFLPPPKIMSVGEQATLNSSKVTWRSKIFFTLDWFLSIRTSISRSDCPPKRHLQPSFETKFYK